MKPLVERLVSEKFTVVRPVAAAVTVYGPPAVAFAVNGADATPDTSVAMVIVVVLLLNTPDAPVPGAVNATFTPETGLFPASFTVATNGAANVVLIVALCGVPLVAVMLAGVAARLVSEKFTVVSPVAAAVTVYGPPVVAFAVNGADATPNPFVATVIVAVLLLKTPDAPDPGAVNVTFTPETGLLPASFTVTASAFAKAVLIVALCGVPAVGVIVAGGPVTVKFTPLLATPPTVTTTVAFPAAIAGTCTVMLVALQLLAVPADVPLNVTVLAPCGVLKFVPVIVTDVPTCPVAGFRLVMPGDVPPPAPAALNAATAAPQLLLGDSVALAAIPPAVP